MEYLFDNIKSEKKLQVQFMKKALFLLLAILIGLFFNLFLVKPSQATVSYHYRYQILTQGSSYEAGKNLEIKLYIKVENEQVQRGSVTVNYDSSALKLNQIKKWDIFEITSDTSQTGKIQIEGTTTLQYNGEAPIAYLYFTTLKAIPDLNQILTLNANPITQPTAIATSTPIVTNPDPTQAPTATIAPTPTISQPTPAPTSGTNITGCPNIEGNGPLTLVIIPDKYTDLIEFETDAKLAVESLKKTNLSEATLSKFTFRYSSDLGKDYQILITSQNVDLNMTLARLTQQNCQGDAFLIITQKYPTKASSFGTGGFSTIGGMMAVVLKHSLFVTPHELGHALPGLFDEYDFQTESQEPANYYNCSGSDQSRCQEWRQKYPTDSQIGCFAICGYRNWFRSTEHSTMNNDPAYIDYYNPPSLDMWQTFINKY